MWNSVQSISSIQLNTFLSLRVYVMAMENPFSIGFTNLSSGQSDSRPRIGVMAQFTWHVTSGHNIDQLQNGRMPNYRPNHIVGLNDVLLVFGILSSR
jgi:hypothetical protein